MKVLAKIGLVAAAAATVLFIFVFEVYKPKLKNQTMSAAPEAGVVTDVPEVNEPTPSPIIQEQTSVPEEVIETPESTTPVETPIEPIVETPVPEESSPVEDVPSVQMRRIYGKITLATSGENLAGVNIMIPGSNVAKVSNNIGGYTIQIPRGTRELVFIYRGKKMVQRLSSSNNLLNVKLNLETMQYD